MIRQIPAPLLAAALSAGLLAGGPAEGPVAAFGLFWSRAQGQSFEVQLRLWDQMVEQPRQALYEAAVWETRDHPDWPSRKARLLRARFAAYGRIAGQIPAAAEALASALPGQAARFRALFPDAAADPAIEVVLAPNFDAKSGLRADGTPVLLLAVDSLVLEQVDLDILLAHELFHLYHATRAGIRDDGVMPGATLRLPLFAEGFATYVSSLLAPGRTDGQLLLQEDLGVLPERRLPEISRRFLADADVLAADPAHPEAFRRWFNVAPKGTGSDLPDRTGYWLGLQVVRHLRRTHRLAEMAAWPPARAEAETLAVLRCLAGVPQASAVRVPAAPAGPRRPSPGG